MDKKTEMILKEVLSLINPDKEDTDSIEEFVSRFMNELTKKLKQHRISAEIFIGGSFAKKTLVKKGIYDIDVFVRFDEKYTGKDISGLLKKTLKELKKGWEISVIHGSRDYFKVKPAEDEKERNFFIELIPVLKVKSPKQAENITDLSYFHVNYIRKKIAGKLINDVKLAKAFCHANNCYGAESYINGFSGYALELLICHYKGFIKFLKAMASAKGKEIIDSEKLYKSKHEITMNMNSSKMSSPIILIDPTYRERNALAALSEETFQNFRKACKKFLEKPSAGMFSEKKADYEKIKNNSKKSRNEFILLEAETEKQEGDVAGSKLAKFYKHLMSEINKFYIIKNSGFDYNAKKEAKFFFVVKSRGEIIITGPEAKDKKNSAMFRKRHRNTFMKKGKIYAKEKIKNTIRDFIKEWMNKNSEKMIEMHIREMRILES